MNRFAFVIHNTDWGLISKAFDEPLLDFPYYKDIEKQRMIERVLRWTEPFKCSKITGIKSSTGKKIEGFFIFSMLVPEQFLNMKGKVLIEHLEKAGIMAREMGAKIVGLGAYTALVGKRGKELAQKINIPVTTGSAYTVVAILESIFLAAKKVHLDTRESVITIVGATGKIGRVCASMLARSGQVKEICLVARNQDRLDNVVADVITVANGTEVYSSTNLKSALRKSNAVLFTTNYPHTMVSEKDFMPGTIICDASVPNNVPKALHDQRKDILLFEGGIVNPPGDVKFHFFFGPEKGLAYACIAETMILCLEGKFENYSVGGNISIEKVIKIKALGEKHGFRIAKIKSQYGKITKKRMNATQSAIAERGKELVLA